MFDLGSGAFLQIEIGRGFAHVGRFLCGDRLFEVRHALFFVDFRHFFHDERLQEGVIGIGVREGIFRPPRLVVESEVSQGVADVRHDFVLVGRHAEGMREEFVYLDGIRGREIQSVRLPFRAFLRSERLPIGESVEFLEYPVGLLVVDGSQPYAFRIEFGRFFGSESSVIHVGFEIQIDISSVQKAESGDLVSLFFELGIVYEGDWLEVREFVPIQFGERLAVRVDFSFHGDEEIAR